MCLWHKSSERVVFIIYQLRGMYQYIKLPFMLQNRVTFQVFLCVLSSIMAADFSQVVMYGKCTFRQQHVTGASVKVNAGVLREKFYIEWLKVDLVSSNN